MKVIISLNTAWNLLNFRVGLIRSLVEQGYEVVAVAPYDHYALQLPALGCRYVPLAMDNKGTSPVQDILLAYRFFRLFIVERPDVFLGYTVKPNVYGSSMAHLLDIPVINNIAGLGAVFIKDGLLARFVRKLYQSALNNSSKVFFQNNDDCQLFISDGLVRPETTDLLPGSGVDLNKFSVVPPRPFRGERRKFRFLLVARMLWDKGVGEYVEAAKLLHQHWPEAECCLLGFLDVKNPAAISREQMEEWVVEGYVNYLGVSDDVREQIVEADCVVLPSYREGTPRSLLEASAMGRPVITTDTVGCREAVDDGYNGLICKLRDPKDLYEKMQQMLLLSDEQRQHMGLCGREKMEREFDEQFVIDKYLAAIRQIKQKNTVCPNSQPNLSRS